jgi:hypothetical protein
MFFLIKYLFKEKRLIKFPKIKQINQNVMNQEIKIYHKFLM